jgi:hypothetical protein
MMVYFIYLTLHELILQHIASLHLIQKGKKPKASGRWKLVDQPDTTFCVSASKNVNDTTYNSN